MADDEFSAVTSIALGQFAIGAVTAVGELHSSNLGIALAGGLTTVLGWWQWRSAQQSARLNAGGNEVVANECRRLDAEMSLLRDQVEASGGKLDPLDALTTEHVLSDFVTSTVQAKTPQKRTAIARAAARQFDPRLGPQYVREHWFERLRLTPDLSLALLTLVEPFGPGAFFNFHDGHLVGHVEKPKGGKSTVGSVPLSESEIIAYREAANRLRRVNDALVRDQGADGFFLSDAGLQVASFAKAIGEGPPPAPRSEEPRHREQS